MARNRQNLNIIYISDRMRETLRPIASCALTAVVAPMGYGKTTAVRWFLAEQAKAGAVVLQASIYSDNRSIFWKSVQKAFAAAGLTVLEGYDCPADASDAALLLEDLCAALGGKTPYGFRTEPYVMDGVRTKKLVIEPTEAAFVRQMYEMYADPQVSLHDITKKLTADGMRTYHGRPLSRATLSVILRNPIYVMADLDIYEFYKSQGTDIYNDAADFAGTNGCYYYQGKGNTEDKHKHLQGQTLVLAPHEGFIPSELWLKCRKKLLASHTYQPARKARNTWMAGKIKCGKCGYALMSAHSNGILYLRCTVHADSKACPGCGCVKLHELEAVVYGAMVKKLKDFKTLTGRNKAAKISPKLTAKRLELAQVESEIEKLLDTLTGASPVLLSYANSKIEELDARRQSIANEIAKLSADAVPMEKMESISGYLDDWENVSFEDKRQVVDALITVIRATNEKVEIEWKI